MVCMVMSEEDVLHVFTFAPSLARRLQDDLSMLGQAGVDDRHLVLGDQVRAHIPHPDPVDIMCHTLYTHA